MATLEQLSAVDRAEALAHANRLLSGVVNRLMDSHALSPGAALELVREACEHQLAEARG